MRFVVLLFLIFSLNGFSQWKKYTLSVNGDTLNRLDMKDRKQGPWVLHIDNLRGERGYDEQGYFENDLKEGTWKRFSLEGVKIAEENYRWGKLHGKSQYFTYNGGLEREESWRAMDPKVLYDTVPVYDIKDPSKEIDRVVVKNEGVSMKHGRWIFYEPVWGKIEETQIYVMNKLKTEDELSGDDDIRPIGISDGTAKTDTAGKKTTPKPQAILDYEKKNAGKKKVKVRDGNTGNLPKP